MTPVHNQPTDEPTDRPRRSPPRPQVAWGTLPARLSVLWVTSSLTSGRWLVGTLAEDNATDVELEHVAGTKAAFEHLREAAYDAVLIHHDDELDALDMLTALRAGSCPAVPVLVLGRADEREMAPACYEAGGDGYLRLEATTTRSLIWQLARVVERHVLLEENAQFRQSEQHQLQWDHDESSRLLQQQRAMITELEAVRQGVSPLGPSDTPAALAGGTNSTVLVADYRELLRAYVIMGSGNLVDEIARLGTRFAAESVSGRQVLQLHLHVLEEMVRGLGNRSARHVLNRADMLILELLVHLADGYRGGADRAAAA